MIHRRQLLISFVPAGVGLLVQILIPNELAVRLLALALGLLCVDQARMAVVDLVQAEAAEQSGIPPEQLVGFRRAVWVTIALELIGFYTAAGWLGWGAAGVLLVQVMFNLMAKVALKVQPDGVEVVPFGVQERLPVLVADGVGLGLVGLWLSGIGRLGSAIALLTLVIAYLALKHGPVIRSQIVATADPLQ